MLEASPPTNATLDVAGFRGTSGDITCTATQLLSTVADFTTMGLQVGQFVWVGGTIGGANAFATAACRGYVQVSVIAAHALTFVHPMNTFTTDAGTGKLIDIYFYNWCRNVPSSSADYVKRSYSAELAYQNIGASVVPEYVYAHGLMVSQVDIAGPSMNLAKATVTFEGQTMDDITASRNTGPSTAIAQVATARMNVVTQMTRISMNNIDDTGISTDVSDWTLSIKNNIERIPVQGFFGSKYLVIGNMDVSLKATYEFTEDDMIHAVRDNRQVRAAIGMNNGDGGVLFDLPALTLSSDGITIALNKAVKLNSTATAFKDPTFGYLLGVSMFSYLPVA